MSENNGPQGGNASGDPSHGYIEQADREREREELERERENEQAGASDAPRVNQFVLHGKPVPASR